MEIQVTHVYGILAKFVSPRACTSHSWSSNSVIICVCLCMFAAICVYVVCTAGLDWSLLSVVGHSYLYLAMTSGSLCFEPTNHIELAVPLSCHWLTSV